MKFHHIGYLTNDINKTFNDFKKLGYKKKNKLFTDKIFKVKIQFIQNFPNIIELIKPDKLNYGLINILNNKNYAYHFAYKVKNVDKEVAELKKNFKLIVNPTKALAFRNKRVSFLKMKNDFIIELIQS